MAKIKLLIVLLILAFSANAQTTETVLDSLYIQYSVEKPLNFKSNYTLFKTHDSKEMHQSYKGEFHKNIENSIYIKIDETEILNNKSVNIKVSHVEKAMIVSNPELNTIQDYDMSKLLKVYKEHKFIDKKLYWEIELVPNEMTLPYNKIVLHVRKDFFLKKQIFYYDEGINFSKDYTKTDINKPRLEIVYSGYNRAPSNTINFETTQFLQVKSDAPIIPAARLGDYELIDNR